MLSWLHLSDLHLGAPDAPARACPLHPHWLDDLSRLHDRSGPWDLLVMTGDLTHSGADSEWKLVREYVAGLRAYLAQLGSTPSLIVVPGNHDLDRATLSAVQCEELSRLSTHTQLETDASWPAVAHLRHAFASFMKFSAEFSTRTDGACAAGILPGDFRMTLERQGDQRPLRIGVLGLNTACRAAVDNLGPISGLVSVDQLAGVCGWDTGGWMRSHDLVLLVTHHPRSAIAPSAFAAIDESTPETGLIHLCGHMGQPSREQPWLLQAPSCLGRLRWGQNRQRLMGFLAARIECGEEPRTWNLRRWPRLFLGTGDELSVVADHSFELDAQESVRQPIALHPIAADARAWHPRAARRDEKTVQLPPAPPGQIYEEVIDVVAPSGVARRNTRRALQQTLRTDSDFDAFCLDYFPWVHRRFASGMDRTQKCNILLSSVGDKAVFGRLAQQGSLKDRRSCR